MSDINNRTDRWLQLSRKREQHLIEASNIARQMNALTIPGSLSAELLAEVFALASQDESLHHRHKSDDLLTLTSVSHHWREVALHTPQLWTHFDLEHYSEHRRRLIIGRSGNRPLYVSGDIRWANDSVFSMLFDVMHRVHTMEFRGPLKKSALEHFKKRFSSHLLPAPSLKRFVHGQSSAPAQYSSSASSVESEHMDEEQPQTVLWRSGASLFALLDAPHLQYLELSSLNSDIANHLARQCLPELTTLNLTINHTARSRADETRHMSQLSAVLKRATSLKSLDIRDNNALSDLSSGFLHHSRVVLPELQQLLFEGCPSRWGPFFEAFAAPKLSEAWVWLRDDMCQWESVLGPAVDQSLTAAANSAAHLAIAAWLRAGRSVFTVAINISQGVARLDVTVPTAVKGDTIYYTDPSCNMFNVPLPCASIRPLLDETIALLDPRRLTISGWDHSIATLLSTSGSNCAIDHLTFENSPLVFIVSCLSSDPPPLPRLRRIVLFHCFMCTEDEHNSGGSVLLSFFPPETRDCPSHCYRAKSMFRALLEKRRALGIPIETLQICDGAGGSLLNPEEEKALREVVPNIIDRVPPDPVFYGSPDDAASETSSLDRLLNADSD